MEISSILASIKGYNQPSVEKAGEKKTNAAGEHGTHQDKISLSNEGKLLNQAQKAASESPEIRREKIEAFKSEVENGTYKPDSTRIAEKLLQQDIDLLA
jgi:negative regulator of flagellin synthesis FlgM